jgi:uncharacterized membrane protein YidH (DUF202 family)
MGEWNRNEWQGRSRKNYEASALGVVVALGASIVLVAVYMLMCLI